MHIRVFLQKGHAFAAEEASGGNRRRPPRMAPRGQDQDTRTSSAHHGATRLISLVIAIALVSLSDPGDGAGQNVSPTVSRKAPLTSQEAPKLPPPLRPVKRESERGRLRRLSAFVEKNRPRPTTPMNPNRDISFCDCFVDDLINLRGIRAMEPRLTAQSEKEMSRALNLKHCEKLDSGNVILPGVNGDPHSWEPPRFNRIGDVGEPPYRFYELRLDRKRRVTYPVLYHENSISQKRFARLDLKACKIEDHREGYSEKERPNPGLSRIGLNTLVTYKNEVFALILDYSAYPKNETYRLKLYLLTVPPAEGDDCHWWYHSSDENGQDKQKGPRYSRSYP